MILKFSVETSSLAQSLFPNAVYCNSYSFFLINMHNMEWYVFTIYSCSHVIALLGQKNNMVYTRTQMKDLEMHQCREKWLKNGEISRFLDTLWSPLTVLRRALIALTWALKAFLTIRNSERTKCWNDLEHCFLWEEQQNEKDRHHSIDLYWLVQQRLACSAVSVLPDFYKRCSRVGDGDGECACMLAVRSQLSVVDLVSSH